MEYYHKFVKNYPTILNLAQATEQQVLNDWQGLGYYSRARNLHSTAKYISTELGGKFPQTYNELIKLKGVGPYTAAAIASFAYKEPVALVDGNVYRLLSRYFDLSTPIDSTQGKKEFQKQADDLLLRDVPDLFNQAIMEFGSQFCIPKNPPCNDCILNTNCLAYINKTVKIRPVKEKKVKIRERYFYYGVFVEGEKICVQKRIEKDIWQNLYEFPLIEVSQKVDEGDLLNLFAEKYGIIGVNVSEEITHILSHQRIKTRFIHFTTIPARLKPFQIPLAQLDKTPLPRLIDKYLINNVLKNK